MFTAVTSSLTLFGRQRIFFIFLLGIPAFCYLMVSFAAGNRKSNGVIIIAALSFAVGLALGSLLFVSGILQGVDESLLEQ